MSELLQPHTNDIKIYKLLNGKLNLFPTTPGLPQSIERRTVSTNVAAASCLYPHSPQLGYGSNEGILEGLRAGGPCIYGWLGSGICEQNLVRGEQALALLQVLVVHVVKYPGRGWVHVDGYRGIHVPRTHLLKLGCIRLV